MWGEGRCVEEHVEQYAAAVISVLKHLEMLSNDDPTTLGGRKTRNEEATRHCEGEWITAGNGGFFLPNVNIEDAVTKDQRIGVIKGESGELVETLRASVSGFVAAIHTFPMIRPGDGAVMVEKRIE